MRWRGSTFCAVLVVLFIMTNSSSVRSQDRLKPLVRPLEPVLSMSVSAGIRGLRALCSIGSGASSTP